MTRFACAVLGTLALMSPSALRAVGEPARRGDIDAVTFALAFRAGNADQYKNRRISGTGVSFHGPVNERIADGSTRTSLIMTLGSTGPDDKLIAIRSWDDFVAAERARTTLVVALSGPNLPAPDRDAGPASYSFAGVYDGQVRTVVRVPQAADSNAPDAGPCSGEQPRAPAPSSGRFYCAPLLTGASASPQR